MPASHERLQEGVISLQSSTPVLKDVPYDPGTLFRAPSIPEPVHNQVYLLSNTDTGATLIISEESTTSAKDIRKKKPNRLVLISMQPMPVSMEMNLRTSNYASFLRVGINAQVRVINPVQLFNQYKSNLNQIQDDIGSVFSNECYEEARRISRNYGPQDYAQLEEDLDIHLLSRLKRSSARQDIFAHIDIVDMRFRVNLTEEHEEILHKAAFADYENNARRSTLMSDLENMRAISMVMNSGEDADIWLEVAQGRLTPSQAVDKINQRKYDLRNKEIEQIQKINQQGVMSDKDVRGFMRDVLSNAVDRSNTPQPRFLTGDAQSARSEIGQPRAADIPDLDDDMP